MVIHSEKTKPQMNADENRFIVLEFIKVLKFRKIKYQMLQDMNNSKNELELNNELKRTRTNSCCMSSFQFVQVRCFS